MAQQATKRRKRQRRRRPGVPRRQGPSGGGGGGNGGGGDNGGGGLGKRIAGGIAIVAALVGIASGVRALLPADTDELVTLGPVELTEGTRLSEYEARTTVITSEDGAAERGANVVFATLLAQAPDPTATADPSATPTPTVEPTVTETPTATATVEPTATGTPTADPTIEPRSLAPEQQLRLVPDEVDAIDSVVQRTRDAAPELDLGACGNPDELPQCPMLPIVNEIVLPDGGAGSPAEAARRVVAILKSARQVDGGRRKDVLGVLVGVDAVLTGFGDEDVRIAWSLYRIDGGRLPKSWLREVTVLRFRVDNDRAHRVSQPFWAPLPKAKGRYKLVITAYDQDGHGRGSIRTKAFS